MSLESLIVGLLTFGSILLKSNTSAGTFDSQSRYQSGCILPLVEFPAVEPPVMLEITTSRALRDEDLGGWMSLRTAGTITAVSNLIESTLLTDEMLSL